MARGLVGSTRNLDGFCIGSTWPSWYTGVTPARHGLHYLVQLRPGTLSSCIARRTERLVKRDAFWSHLSRAGRRVAVLDVPVSAIDRSLNGVQTVEWGGHDAPLRNSVAPNGSRRRELSRRFGAHPLATPCDEIGRTAEGYRDFVSRLVAGVQSKTKWTLDLLGQGGWDFFVQVFTEAHCAGHQCWHLHDRAHPAHDSRVAAETGDPLRSVYQAIDTGIGRGAREGGRRSRSRTIAARNVARVRRRSSCFAICSSRSASRSRCRRARRQPASASRASDGLRAVWRRLPRSVRDRIGSAQG